MIPAYEAYLRESSFPYTQQLGGEDFDIQEYLRGLFNTLLLHDVVARLKINDVTILQDMVRYILENIVFLELIRRGYTVYVGQLAKGEIDFVAQKAGVPEYYQVSETVLDPNTLSRELAPLEAVQDQYPKFLLTLDELNKNANYDGIQQRNVLEWLLESC